MGVCGKRCAGIFIDNLGFKVPKTLPENEGYMNTA